ncbi:MAG: hypothetical protein IKB04_09220 [Clostridia bacterium]|nr:hypothetical protein [Clostridia bacterium]MBR2407198.1 hypothetical protein [Clostridia bacterium]
MTVKDCLRQAMRLLNYPDPHAAGSVPAGDGVYKQGLAVVDQITAELWYVENDTPYTPFIALSDEIPLSDRTAQTVLPYGVAMLLAQLQGDADNQTVYAALYDQRRSAVRQAPRRIHDGLPGVRG